MLNILNLRMPKSQVLKMVVPLFLKPDYQLKWILCTLKLNKHKLSVWSVGLNASKSKTPEAVFYSKSNKQYGHVLTGESYNDRNL